MGPEGAPGLHKLILLLGLIKGTGRNHCEGEHLCAKLKHTDLANCAHQQTHPLYCVYSCMRQKARLMAWTKLIWISVVQPMTEAVFAGSSRSGAFQCLFQVAHHQPEGLQPGLIRNACTDKGLELLCEQPQHYSAEPHEKQPYLGQGQQLKYDNKR